MLTIIDGIVRDSRVKVELCPLLAHGPLGAIHAIVVHQTGSDSAAATLNGYRNPARPDGAHFLIDKDGTTYQTASIKQKCWHVGQLKSRCMEEHTCDPKTQKTYDGYLKQKGWTYQKTQMYHDERQLSYPQRFPEDEDSIGIEIVSPVDHSGDVLIDGKPSHNKDRFFAITQEEQHSLDWLINQLLDSLHLTRKDIFRHGQISYKLKDEGQSARF